jgi:hypothetical protein
MFLTSALEGGWSPSLSGHLTSQERAPGTRWIGGSVDPSAVWAMWRRESKTWKLNLGSPASNPSLYRLSCPDSYKLLFHIHYFHNIIYEECLLWDIAPCALVEFYWCSGWTYCLQIESWSKPSKQTKRQECKQQSILRRGWQTLHLQRLNIGML